MTEGLYADELIPYSGTAANVTSFYMNSIDAKSASDFVSWTRDYNYIYQAKVMLENVSGNSAITANAARQFIGECKFIRAFWYFYLANEYGDVPLITSSDYEVNGRASRTPVVNVYNQMIADLIDAQTLLNDGYVDASDTTVTNPIDRQRPPKWAATAMLARCYLYRNKYDSAEAYATTVINQSNFFGLTSIDSVFLANSREAIWQIGAPSTVYYTQEGFNFVPVSDAPNYTINPQLLSSFEPGDLRQQKWIGTYTQIGYPDQYYPYKYKAGSNSTNVTEYKMMLRLAEQYLIRAEARAQRGNLSGAASDLNAIRNRAGLSNVDDTTASSQAALLAAIQHERQVELFTEWGHRWFDLKRTGQADAVMSVVCPLKGGQWESYKLLFPIPYNDILVDNNLVQNPGY